MLHGLFKTLGSGRNLPAENEVIAGALLHDIAKTPCLKSGCNHAREGQRICVELGHPEIGIIVAEHVILEDFASKRYRQGIFNAREIVFYADKRVRHDRVVSLAERLEYILERYGNGDPVRERHIRLNFSKTVQFENIIFTFLDFHPENLPEMIPPVSRY